MFDDWANERCNLGKGISGASRLMYLDYAVWHNSRNLKFVTIIKWGKYMKNRFVRYKCNGRIRYRGIALRSDINAVSEFDI